MLNQFSRTQLLFGKEKMEKLYNAKVAVFGVGGVGGHCIDALARAGIAHIDIFDDDKICITNVNRQLIATKKTVGRYKVDVMKEHILSINPKATVNAYNMFYMPNNSNEIDLSVYDYIVDSIDTVTGKIELVMRAKELGVPIICSMGAANKLDPTAFVVTDIYKTSVCPLAKVMRKELRVRGVDKLKVVYSKEEAMKPFEDDESSCEYNCVCPSGTTRKCTDRRQIPASNSFVPPTCGLILAGEVIKDIANRNGVAYA
ncbi:MAG: tRNA threonylcarbamoyladenosine dehydratase [Defluviitaleaceae bacterium]|nr:tRNA threonylcarbamoyladenosine dehydratase [Defluviitaleaceae bacterium]